MSGQAGPPVFDRARTLKRLDNDEELLAFALDNFRQHAPTLLGSLREALDRGQARDAHRHAHSLAGSSAAIAAESLLQQARRLEELAAAGLLDEARQALPALQRLMDRFLAESAAG